MDFFLNAFIVLNWEAFNCQYAGPNLFEMIYAVKFLRLEVKSRESLVQRNSSPEKLKSRETQV